MPGGGVELPVLFPSLRSLPEQAQPGLYQFCVDLANTRASRRSEPRHIVASKRSFKPRSPEDEAEEKEEEEDDEKEEEEKEEKEKEEEQGGGRRRRRGRRRR